MLEHVASWRNRTCEPPPSSRQTTEMTGLCLQDAIARIILTYEGETFTADIMRLQLM